MDEDGTIQQDEFQLAGRATYLKIHLDRILDNLRLLKTRCSPQTDMLCVLKANAYGHGSVAVAKCLQEHGYAHFAVSTTLEGEQLRTAGVSGFIQVFGNANAVDIPALYNSQLTPTVADTEFLSVWCRYAKRKVEHTTNARTGIADLEEIEYRPQPVVIKIDTGMYRNGCKPRDLPNIVQVCNSNKVQIHSMMTHFSKPLDDLPFTKCQMDLFMETVKPYRECGMKLHVASSGAILNDVGTDLDFVRPGIAMYGQAWSSPLSLPLAQELGLNPAIEWRAMATLVKEVENGHFVGYDAAYRCTSTETIAVIPVGFADGYSRQNYCKGHLTTSDGVPCPVIGKISMDTITVSLPEAAKTAREFTVMAADFNDVNSCNALAKSRNTITSEILTNLSMRVPRLYKLRGQLTAEK